MGIAERLSVQYCHLEETTVQKKKFFFFQVGLFHRNKIADKDRKRRLGILNNEIPIFLHDLEQSFPNFFHFFGLWGIWEVEERA